ncbi:hypothetical protein DCCM_3783 [Desulfocucumis palustris]|uniref:Uncharacterized protein n=1 Tax=Desulfocucumis palustris TaxID=1898651 RepID=A0A2L2XG24_9FIRM|nr:hypothetical protein DCCM_3783 [Desulfocucumis palustris]
MLWFPHHCGYFYVHLKKLVSALLLRYNREMGRAMLNVLFLSRL